MNERPDPPLESQKRTAVLRVLAGEPPEQVASQLGVDPKELARWCDAARAGIDLALRECCGDTGDGSGPVEPDGSQPLVPCLDARFCPLLDNLFEGIQILDREWRYRFMNATAAAHARRPREELLGRTLFECHPDVERTAMFQVLQDCMHNRVPRYFEDEFRFPDGSSGWFQLHIYPTEQGICVQSLDLTLRRRAEQATRDSEERLRALMRHIPGMVYRMGAGGAMEMISGCEPLCGFTDRALLEGSVHWLDLVHPDDRLRVDDESRALYAGPASANLQYRIVRNDGSVIWVSDHKSSIFSADGAISAIDGIAFDVSARKRAEEALALVAQQRQIALDAAQLGWWHYDPITRISSWDSRYREIFGITDSESPNDERLAQLDPDDLAALWPKVEAALDPVDPQPYFAEYRVTRPDGDIVWVRAHGLAIFEGEGSARHAVSFVGTVEDITDRKQAERRLKQLSAAVTQSPMGVAIVDLPGRVEYINPRFTAITGYREEEILGKRLDILRSDTTAPAIYASLREAVESEREWSGELTSVRKDGTHYQEQILLAPIRDARGTASHYVVLSQDITEQRDLEQRYQQAQRMESIGQLAGGVAHDFNNILQTIIGYASALLTELPEGYTVERCAEEVLVAAESASALTAQLLLFSRRQPPQFAPINLDSLVLRTMRMVHRVMPEVIQVEVVAPGHPVAVRADRGQLDQVILNLCINARDAMPDGGKLTVRTEAVELNAEYCDTQIDLVPGSYAVLTVSDTGHGMDHATQGRIFDPFFTTKPMGKGTGLGLATVYGIVKQHRGAISVYSEPGVGTTFRVYLPRVEDPVSDLAEAPLPPPRGGTETLLLAEDDDSVRTILSTVLRRAGYTVLCTADGKAALEAVHEHHGEIALVISDIIMPKMGGSELYQALVRDFPDMRFLFSSGYGSDVVNVDALIGKNVQLIQKPYMPKALLRKVREMLDAPPPNA